jgi:hypothetical protein
MRIAVHSPAGEQPDRRRDWLTRGIARTGAVSNFRQKHIPHIQQARYPAVPDAIGDNFV